MQTVRRLEVKWKTLANGVIWKMMMRGKLPAIRCAISIGELPKIIVTGIVPIVGNA
jgi:hypothetical protein